MTYQTAAIPLSLSDLQCHSPMVRDFSYSFAAGNKMLADVARRAVPLRQLSLVFIFSTQLIWFTRLALLKSVLGKMRW